MSMSHSALENCNCRLLYNINFIRSAYTGHLVNRENAVMLSTTDVIISFDGL